MFLPENGQQTVAGITLLRISQHFSLNTEVCGNVIRNVIFIDTQVYSSHRHFRLVSSAKFVDVGQRHFRYIVPKDNGYVTEKVTLEVFFKTLPSYYGDVPRESVMILKWNYHQYQKSLEFKSPDSNPQLNSKQIINKNESTSRFHKLISFFESDVLTWWSSVFNSYSNLELLSIGKVVYYESSEQLILRPKANRFCSNVKRQHKRNGIYFVINIPEFNFTQKCHDHTCAGYQSESFTLDPALFFVRSKRKHRFCKDYNASKKRKDQ